ncbi:MAG TPA: orotate phosphoribosyltransferase [Bacteroidota bacterium]|jgi:orotate phosphoribosyltransferase|nr:orotate phosphoribosyltransferase [Bacteroidota bacterium]
MTIDERLELFKKSGAFLEGHFLLSSGLHSPQYVEKFRVLEYPQYTEKLCYDIANHFRDDNVELVIGPMTGGILLAHEVAKSLSVKSMFTERVDNVMSLRRGFYFNKGTRILLVEDVVTTGGSIFEVIELIRKLGGDIVGVGYLVDRSGGKVDFGVPQFPLIKLDIITYKPEECPLCKQGIELVKPGSKKIG